jgi:hypothetical protein
MVASSSLMRSVVVIGRGIRSFVSFSALGAARRRDRRVRRCFPSVGGKADGPALAEKRRLGGSGLEFEARADAVLDECSREAGRQRVRGLPACAMGGNDHVRCERRQPVAGRSAG